MVKCLPVGKCVGEYTNTATSRKYFDSRLHVNASFAGFPLNKQISKKEELFNAYRKLHDVMQNISI